MQPFLQRHRADDLWADLKALIARRLTPQEFRNWIEPTTQESCDHGALRVWVPDAVTKEALEVEYGPMILDVLAGSQIPVTSILYLQRSGTPRMPASTGAPAPARAITPEFFAPAQLNPRFTFDNFAVGPCNQFAHAAAWDVVVNPSRKYNPLFLYGGVGMGKTHLMQAIAASLIERYPGMRVIYTSGEKFMNEMVGCIRANNIAAFQRHYRAADALIVDEVHAIAGKERTQDEFFHTFNELYDHQKQIVVSSDAPPSEQPGLADKIRSRFEWGLTAEITSPDLDTKMSILDKRAEGVGIPDDVRVFIATKTRSNLREMEGAVVKIEAMSSLSNAPITMAMAQRALAHLVRQPDRRVTNDAILRAVSEHYGLTIPQIRQKSNARAFTFPRHVAMHLMKELNGSSYPEIGKVFGGKHHTTAMYGIEKIEKQRAKDPELDKTLHSIVDGLRSR